jgi:predicted enzyme related to lactoylglutathione lyase
MPDRPTSDPEQFIQGAPVLPVADVESTSAYFRDILGINWDFGDEQYSVVWRDNSAIHLTRARQRSAAGIHLLQWGRDVDACHREVRDRGADVLDEPTDRPYQIREFKVRDPNGIEIVFAQDIY